MAAPEDDSLGGAVLTALGYVFFRRKSAEAFQLEVAPPDWLATLWPRLTSKGATLAPSEASPFLENFLIDAEECWERGVEDRVRSGPWIEQTAGGSEISLEATALTSKGLNLLLIERLGEVFEAKKAMLQHARETIIAQQRLNSEMQKKEILLSCIAEEMNSALANAVTALRLIEGETQSPRSRQLLSLATRATENQQMLINKILDLFARELEQLYHHDESETSSLGEVLPLIENSIAPAASEKRVQLQFQAEDDAALLGVERNQLTKVLSALVENALARSSAGGKIALTSKGLSDTVIILVTDNGAPLSLAIDDDLFTSGKTAPADETEFQLSLRACRIALQNCGGELGYETSANGGNCFSVQVPKRPR